MHLTPKEYGVLVELSANQGQLLTYEQLVRRVWGQGKVGEWGLVRTIIRRLRIKLNDDAESPTYIFNERYVGYWMARGEEQGSQGS